MNYCCEKEKVGFKKWEHVYLRNHLFIVGRRDGEVTDKCVSNFVSIFLKIWQIINYFHTSKGDFCEKSFNMGIIYSSRTMVNNMTNYISGRKRKYSYSDDDEINKVIDIALHTPKR